jgi:hypothetical protein
MIKTPNGRWIVLEDVEEVGVFMLELSELAPYLPTLTEDEARQLGPSCTIFDITRKKKEQIEKGLPNNAGPSPSV